MKRGYWIGKIIVIGAFAIGAFTFVTQWLWNWLIPALFNGPMISFWQTLGLLVLSKILFSGFGGKRHCRNQRWGGWGWRQKWNNLTPEERERFKEKIKNKWCAHHPGTGHSSSVND